MKRKFGVSITYIRILEFQKNGNPHFHILVDRFIPQAWVQQTWQAVGGGRMVNIKFVDVHRVSRYLSKYLTKELLLSAPKRSRRVTVSRGIRLFEKKKSDISWRLIRSSIFVLFALEIPDLADVELDEEGVLKAFVVGLSESANYNVNVRRPKKWRICLAFCARPSLRKESTRTENRISSAIRVEFSFLFAGNTELM